MRLWQSRLDRLWLPDDLKRQLAEDNANSDMSFPSIPPCIKCSREHKRRISVAQFFAVEVGKLPNGKHFVTFRARCHGEENVLRVEGLEWPPTSQRHKIAVASLPFFAGVEPETLRMPDMR